MSTTVLAVVVVVIVVVAAVGAYVALSSRHVTTTTPSNVTTTVPPSNTSVTPLVFYTWWATTGKVALDHLIPTFEETYPQYKIEPEVIPGGGGVNAKYAIIALLEAGKPPATFQSLTGPMMLGFVEATPNGKTAYVNFTPIVEQMGLFKTAVPEVLDAAAYNGTMYTMPVNVHRGATLYISKPLLEKYGLPIPYNLSTLIYDTEALAKDGVPAWVEGGAEGGFEQFMLYEAILLSLGGPRMVTELDYGTLPMDNASVVQILNETNQIYLTFMNASYPGWQTLTQGQAITLLGEGKVAFAVNGNWEYAYLFDFDNITPYPAVQPYVGWNNVSVLTMPFPGTKYYYDLVMDSVAVPKGPEENAGLTLVKYWASWQGQEVWNRWKAVTFYKNDTVDFYNTPSQWYDYQALLNVSADPANFTVSPGSSAGLFPDVSSTLDGALLELAEVGPAALATWMHTLNTSMGTERSEWLTAASLGLGYIGMPGHPLGNYLPPWASDPSQSTTGDFLLNFYTLVFLSSLPSLLLVADLLKGNN
ncbi:hypothetical protein HS1genome_1979 [Sulfodiicoccus acidiphilus]|uniref:Sugar ABC transporter substrate-binding protein n=1 Tax=Sulfodiicoccus acidiphilus TaxID=1670455 RepID=A0A348B5Y8_9CREN|nr:hypothetical protein HS1genome_1979 [Sulfodiicoccus acidiphilus]GGU01639.1 hypothetical protein GCM10007116_18520 [Sulfodiicoccus acidiphilus]